MIKKSILAFTIGCIATNTFATSWEARIVKIQAEGIGDNYNVLYLDHDITNSACQKTNDKNRLTIVNDVQHSTALAALMAGKKVEVMETGSCNQAGLANINYIMIYSDK